MRSKKEEFRRNIRKRRSRRRKLIRLAVAFLAFAAKTTLTALVVLLMLHISGALNKDAGAAGQQTTEKEAAVSHKAAGQQAAPGKKNGRAAEAPFVPLDVPMAEEDQKAVFDICSKYNVAFTLVMAMIEHESNFDASARSGTGDNGLMQINDCNSARLAEMGFNDLSDARENVEAAVYMLRELFVKYGEVEAVLMCYNMGEAGAAALWQQGIFSSDYSSEIMAREAEFSAYIDNQTTNK